MGRELGPVLGDLQFTGYSLTGHFPADWEQLLPDRETGKSDSRAARLGGGRESCGRERPCAEGGFRLRDPPGCVKGRGGCREQPEALSWAESAER